MMLEELVTWTAALSLPIWLVAEEIMHRAHTLTTSEPERRAQPAAAQPEAV